ncbi:MAG TPA: ABC transporter permease [Thermoanaerobaculia bacterium]|nr:ABC transporter permease [Thermoanaerobaculia bacterium]
MRATDKLRLRLRSLFRQASVEAELHRELGFHLEQQIEENVAAGMSPAEARYAALRAMGGLTQIAEECRDMRRTRWMENLLQDLRYAARTLRLSPAFTAVAVLSLALGIGANTAIFSLIDALLLRRLPVSEPQGLVALGNPARTGSLSEGSVRGDLFSVPMYRELRDRNRVFSGLFGSGRVGRLTVGLDRSTAAPESARGRLVTGNYFAVLGVSALRGRVFTADEDKSPGSDPYVVISYDYWRRRFAADPGIVGRILRLNDYPFTVVGVTPPGFFGDVVGAATDVWVPLMMQRQVNPGRDYLDKWDVSFLLLMGRLRPGVSIGQAGANVNGLFSQIVSSRAGGAIAADFVPDPSEIHVEVTPGASGFSSLRQQFSRPLETLMAIVGLVLLIACASVANLLLERATGRQKELSVRLAVGAGRGRLVRQLLTESVLLAALGGALGVLVASWADTALLGLAGASRSAALDLKPNLQVLAFTAAVSLLTGILFGLAPALRATRVELAPALKESSRSLAGAGSGRRWPLGKVLVVAQFTLSLLLLMAAGLFLRTLVNLQRLDLGYRRDGLVVMRVDPVAAGYSGARLEVFSRQLLDRLKNVPAVSGVTLSENGVFSGTESSSSISFPGVSAPAPAGAPRDSVNYDRVGPDYFKVLGIPVLAGRGIGAEDRAGAPRVAVVNETLARFYFRGQSPLGKRLVEGPLSEQSYEIVGVAKDVRDHALRGEVPRRFYTPLLQSAESISAFNFELRTAEPTALLERLRQTVRGFDPRLAILDLAPVGSLIDDSIGDERLVAKLAAVFGVLALALASIGLYGVISYTIARRTNEIGIRMALGARRQHVLWMVLRETLLLALAGVALGVPAVLVSARVVASRLYGLSASDPATLAAASGLLLLVAVVAGAIPGSRATRVDPTEALRYE